jgi:hypothetical protein
MSAWYTCTGGKVVERGRICRYCGARPAGDECRGPLPQSQWARSVPEPIFKTPKSEPNLLPSHKHPKEWIKP